MIRFNAGLVVVKVRDLQPQNGAFVYERRAPKASERSSAFLSRKIETTDLVAAASARATRQMRPCLLLGHMPRRRSRLLSHES